MLDDEVTASTSMLLKTQNFIFQVISVWSVQTWLIGTEYLKPSLMSLGSPSCTCLHAHMLGRPLVYKHLGPCGYVHIWVWVNKNTENKINFPSFNVSHQVLSPHCNIIAYNTAKSATAWERQSLWVRSGWCYCTLKPSLQPGLWQSPGATFYVLPLVT